jgi:predicted Ser/Thr protein kinase
MHSEVIGNYRVERELGRGGMGVVYRATEIATGEAVALKVLSREFALEPDYVKRFKRETEALDRLDHPNIVRVFRVGEHEGLHYYAMDFVEGRSLGAMLSGGDRLGVERALDLAIEVATALGHAHKAGIIHRDIKPGNILLDREGKPKLTDFGIARLTYATRMTRTGDIVGTPEYMSPEQAKGSAVDAPSDVYSLGVVLYELLTGKVPFEGATALEIIKKHQYEQPANIRELNRAVHDGLARVVMKMLAKEPKERYKSAEQVATALLVVRDAAIRLARSRKKAVSGAATLIMTSEEETGEAPHEAVVRPEDFTEKRCPKCEVVLSVGDRICIACGTDLRTGGSVRETAVKLERQQLLMKVGTAIGATVPLAAFLAMVVLRMGVHYIKIAALLSTLFCIITLVGGSARQESIAKRIYIGLFVGLLMTILYGVLWDTSPPFAPLFTSGQ